MKKITWIYIRFVQRILITIFLTLTYFVVFPITWLGYRFLSHEKLYKKHIKQQSYWKTEPIINDSVDYFTNQS